MNKLGIGSFSNTNAPDFVFVGNYSSIAQDVYFHDGHDNHLCVKNRKCVYSTNWEQHEDAGGTHIGNDVWIGRNVKIMYGVTIGDGAIIGAYSVIAKDVPPFAVVVGNPQRITRFRFTKPQIKKLLKIKWWDRENMKEKWNEMQDIDVFLKNEK